MKDISNFLNIHKQNNKLPILLISPGFGHIYSEKLKDYGLTHRKPYYFFLFMLEGTTCQGPYGPMGCDHKGSSASTVS